MLLEALLAVAAGAALAVSTAGADAPIQNPQTRADPRPSTTELSRPPTHQTANRQKRQTSSPRMVTAPTMRLRFVNRPEEVDEHMHDV